MFILPLHCLFKEYIGRVLDKPLATLANILIRSLSNQFIAILEDLIYNC